MWTVRRSHLRLVEPDCHLPPPLASDCCVYTKGMNMLLPISSPFCPLCSVYMMFPYAVVLVPLKVSSADVAFGNLRRNASCDPVTVPGELPEPA